MFRLNPFLTLRGLATAGALALALFAPASNALADSPAHFFTKSGVRGDRMSVIEAYFSGKTMQTITHLGLRWLNFEPGGRWHARGEKLQSVTGSWEVEDGKLCLKDNTWFTKRACFTFYGDGEEPIGYSTTNNADRFYPASFFQTSDPADGVGETMAATLRAGGAFPFPARTERLHASARELAGWRLDITGGSGPVWLEFHPRGELEYPDRDDKVESGKWSINEYGDVCLDAEVYWTTPNCYDLLGGSRIEDVNGVRDFSVPLSFFPARVSRVPQ